MRIAISGAAGTGKSLLAQELAKIYNVEFIEEGIRKYLEYKNIEHFRNMSPKETMEMQWSILNNKILREKKLKNFIADRSTADNLAYALRWCARETTEIPKSEMKHYIEVCQEHCNIYDIIFVLPCGSIPLEDDKVRSMNENYHYEMECTIVGALTKWGCSFEYIDSSSLQDRIKECQDIMHFLFR